MEVRSQESGNPRVRARVDAMHTRAERQLGRRMDRERLKLRPPTNMLTREGRALRLPGPQLGAAKRSVVWKRQPHTGGAVRRPPAVLDWNVTGPLS
jgi:hypothetical protein